MATNLDHTAGDELFQVVPWVDLTVACMTGLNVAVYKKQNCPLHLFQGHVIINVPYNGILGHWSENSC